MVIILYLPTNHVGEFEWSTSLPTFHSISPFGYFGACAGLLFCSFNLYFPEDWWFWASFHVLTSSLVKNLFVLPSSSTMCSISRLLNPGYTLKHLWTFALSPPQLWFNCYRLRPLSLVFIKKHSWWFYGCPSLKTLLLWSSGSQFP